MSFQPVEPGDFLEYDLEGLREITLTDFGDIMTPEEFDHIFRTCDALWLHSGDPSLPHAELTSGRCSDGFVDVLRVLRYTNLCEVMAYQLTWRFRDDYPDLDPEWVVGSDHAGATLSYAVASLFGVQHDFTEKLEDHPMKGLKSQIWRRHTIEPGELVLQVEELITTTGTLQAVREGIREGNPSPVTFAPVVMTLVHRSDTYEFEGSPILYIRHYDIASWEPEECPLCAAGSKRLRPKQNWAELTGKE